MGVQGKCRHFAVFREVMILAIRELQFLPELLMLGAKRCIEHRV
jgi:hypothetical protein